MTQNLSRGLIRPTLLLEEKIFWGFEKFKNSLFSGALRIKNIKKNQFFTKSKFSAHFEDVYGIGCLAVISPL